MGEQASSGLPIRLPSGGGSVRGIGSDFVTNLNTGLGTYSVPIDLPAGYRGQQPQLALHYSSGVGVDAFGLGWTMGGLDVRRDTRNGPPRFDDGDTLMLGGERLVQVDDATWRPQVDPSFQRVRRSGAGWEVTDRQGTRFLLGVTEDAREVRPGDGAVLAWLVERIEDTSGNVTSYRYLRDGDRLYLQSFEYAVYRFEVEHEARPDVRVVRRGGFAQRLALRARRLALHKPALEPSLLRAYDLEYDQDPLAGHSLLRSVTLQGFLPDAAGELQEERAPALVFGYSEFDPARRSVRTIRSTDGDSPPPLGGAGVELVDLDGFGLPGILEVTGPTRRYWANRGNGTWSPPVRLRGWPEGASLGDERVRIADVDGDARPDVLVSSGALRGWYPGEERRDWGPLRAARHAPAVDARQRNVRLLDGDGDGRVDVVVTTDRAMLLYPREGQGWGERAEVRARDRDDPSFPDVSFDDARVRHADMTGDGLLDVVRLWAGAVEVWPGEGTLSWGDRTVLTFAGAPARFDESRCHLVDVNGDGLADVVYVDHERVLLWVNRGDSFGDPIEIGYPPLTATTAVRAGDVLGTGTSGILFCVAPRPGARDPYRFLDLTGGVKPHLLTRVDTGTGKTTTITYGSSALHRVRDRDAGHDWDTTLPTATQVVDRIDHLETTTGAASATEFRYHDGSFDPVAQRFAGFGEVEAVERHGPRSEDVLTRSTFHLGRAGDVPGLDRSRAAALRGRLWRRETWAAERAADPGAAPYLVEETQWDVSAVASDAAGTEVLFPFQRARRVERVEETSQPVATVTELEHDAFGNVVLERRRGPGPDGELVVDVAASYLNLPDRWQLGLQTRVTTTSGGTRLEDVRMSYDGLPHGSAGAGLVSRRERLAFTQAQLDGVFGEVVLPDLESLGYRSVPGDDGVEWWCDEFHATYDARGNVVTHVDPLGRVATVDYDADALLPVRSTNALGHVYEAEYHPRLDAIAVYRDPNGRETRFTYTPLGRVAAEHRPGDGPGDPTVRFEYRTDALPIATVMTRKRAGAPPRRSVTYYDGLGEELQTRARRDDGRFHVTGVEVRDARGLVIERHPPFASPHESFDPSEGQQPLRCYRYRYDALRRPLEISDPEDGIASASYAPDSMTFRDVLDNAPGSPAANTPRVQRLDAFGRLVAVEEHTPQGAVVTRYAYDGHGRLARVDDVAGTLLTQEHDTAGNLLRVDHRDAGLRRFLSDPRGTLVLYVDALGRRVEWEVDALQRPLTVTVDGTVVDRFTYDAGPGDDLVGRLVEAEDALGKQEFAYDASGRTARTTRSIDGHAGVLEYEFEYDEDGRRTHVRYPDGGETAFEYDALGRLVSVGGLVEQIAYDDEGRRVGATFSGGVTETRAYDGAIGRLVEHAVVGPGGRELTRLRMTYDGGGNVSAIADERAAAPGVSPSSRSFEYDALNRVVRATGGPADAEYDHRFGYDDLGNLVRNDAWRPDPVTYDGCRLTAAGADAFGYDANGCLTSRPGMTLEYDARDMLRRVKRDDGTIVELDYDYSARRLSKKVTDAAGPRRTLYVGESFEIRPDGAQVRYVSDPQGSVTAVLIDGELVRTLFHDHTGSVVAVVEALGGEAHDVGYTAFGTRADGGADVGDVMFAGRRFDEETGLYYFRMRYYDPLLGRFVSPDPIAVTGAEKGRIRPLSLNPYVYALDNPLRFTDATGLWTFWEAALTIVIVAVVVVAAAATFGVGGVIALGIGAAVGAAIGGATTGSVDGALAGAMLGFSIVATVMAGMWVGAAIGGAFGAAGFGASVGAFVGGFSAGIQAAGFIPAVRQEQAYKDLLGYTSWVNPWTWPGHIVGGVIFIVNAIVYGAAYVFSGGDPGSDVDMDVTFEHGMIVTTGGWIRPERAFNFGAFTNLNPDDSGVQDPETRDLILRHERGHSLNNAYFGILQVGRMGASSQPESFWEQLAESNVNPHDPCLTLENSDDRRRAGGRGFGDVSWWNP